MGFNGPRFTWINFCEGVAQIKERLDRMWCNLQGHMLWGGTMIQHLPRIASDHRLILLSDTSIVTRKSFKGFCFLNAWLQHPNFVPAVERFWKKEPGDLKEIIEEFKSKLMRWNTKVFGNINPNFGDQFYKKKIF